MTYLYIGLGGVFGAVARFGLGGWITARANQGFPWGTLGVNLLGSLLLGFLMRVLPDLAVRAEWRAFLTIGFCGAFTTFSTFGLETAVLLQQGEYGPALTYVAASVLLGVLAVFAGLAAGGMVG